MNQGLLFCLKEGIGGLGRARFASFVATGTVAISLILIGIFLIITVNLGRLVANLRSRVELEVFLDDSWNEIKIQELGDTIRQIEGVEELTFISKEMAALEFKKLFKDQQDEYFKTLGYNPLPASFRIELKENYRSFSGAEKVFQTIKSLEEINEEDIVYRREFLVILEKYIKIAIAIDFLIGSIVCLSALLLVSNNIRLIIFAKKNIIETMKLVGATKLFIQTPLYIQGTTQGFVGGIISALFLLVILKIAAIEIPGFITVNWKLYIVLAILGTILGLAGSFTAVRRYL
ncbi:MAG: cell division protein FtsX [bacterium]